LTVETPALRMSSAVSTLTPNGSVLASSGKRVAVTVTGGSIAEPRRV